MTLTKIIVFAILWYFIGFIWTLFIFGVFFVVVAIIKNILGTPADRTRAYLKSLEKN